MAGQALTCFLLLLTLNLSFVLCSDDYMKYYHQYGNGNHIKTSGADVSTTEATVLSNSRQDKYKSDGKYSINTVYQSDYYSSFDEQYRLILTVRIIVIVGAVAYVIITLLIIVCCPCACCRGKRQPGYILSSNTSTRPTEMQQPLVVDSQQTFQPPYPTQQQFQPQFQPAPLQQQSQHSPGNFHNPPISPPPYQEKQHY